MLPRVINLTEKLWRIFLTSIERPKEIPFIVWSTLVKKAYIWDLVNLLPYRQWIKNQNINTVIDIGAHKGEFASAISVILPSAHLYCFEPLLDCYQVLCNQFANHKHFKAFSIALSSKEGPVTFWRSRFSKSSSLLSMDEFHKENYPWSADVTPIEVEMDRLDNFIVAVDLQPKALMKIDVQGAELHVLQGGQNFLKMVDFILVETSFTSLYKEQSFFTDIYSFLIDRGYEFRGNIGQQISSIDGAILQVDALFVRT
jgi:FkbM family methyltransferase